MNILYFCSMLLSLRYETQIYCHCHISNREVQIEEDITDFYNMELDKCTIQYAWFHHHIKLHLVFNTLLPSCKNDTIDKAKTVMSFAFYQRVDILGIFRKLLFRIVMSLLIRARNDFYLGFTNANSPKLQRLNTYSQK